MDGLIAAMSLNQAAVEGGEGQRRPQIVLPLGVCFMPTGQDLLKDYLANEVAGRAVPHWIQIPFRELYVPGADPWIVQQELSFPYGRSGEFYCYTHLSGHGPGVCRTAGSGTWAAEGRDVAVRAKGTRELLGHKLRLKFIPQDGGDQNDPRCNWIMYEYRLPPSPSSESTPQVVLCKIFQRGGTRCENLPAASEGSEAAVSSVTADY